MRRVLMVLDQPIWVIEQQGLSAWLQEGNPAWPAQVRK